MATTLDDRTLFKIDAYWRASNYLSVGQIYLLDNPLLKEPLKREHVKPRLVGHWGTTPGLNFLYVHLNRIIREPGPRHDLHHRAWSRRSCARGACVSGGHLQRGLPRYVAGPGRDAATVQAIQFSRRHPEPRGARDAGFNP